MVAKGHCLNREGKKGFRVSKYLQELACYVGQQLTFDEGRDNLKKIGGINLTDKQLERICHEYGQQLEEGLKADSVVVKDDKLHYAMMDGSMCLIREDGWKEVKLGRVFAEKDMMTIKNRPIIRQSDYTVHLGDHESFLEKFESRVSHLTNMVAIADGARWIWDFWTENYPEAIQILDYFHAIEKIGNWAKIAIKGEHQAKLWVTLQEQYLLNNQVGEVIVSIKEFENQVLTKEGQQLVGYLENNKHRMQYKTYQDKGLRIGSGPIESANKQIIQARLKKSGQRWTRNGLQQVANLRVAYHSDRWDLFMTAIKMAA